MPDFQRNHLALFHRQPGEAMHRGAFRRAFRRAFLKPPPGLQFARQPAPQGTPVISRVIPIAAHAIMFERDRRFRFLQQREEGFLQNIFGFGVAEAQRAAIKNQLRGLFRI